MKKLFLICAALMLSCAMGTAQNTKFGKPSQLDWSMVGWSEAPDAEAIVLCKTLNVEYELQSDFRSYDNSTSELSAESVAYGGAGINKFISEDKITMTYSVKMRTKILKDSGAKYANLDIVYYWEEKDRTHNDDISSLSIVVFDNSTGKVKKRKLNSSCWTEERLDANYMVRHIRVADVKAGDIIEYQYDLTSRRATFLYDWQVQEDIPVLYTKCEMNIPAFLTFNMNVPVHPFVKSKVEEASVTLPQEISDLQAPKKVKSNYYTIESRDMLPKALDLQRRQSETPAATVGGEGDFEALKAILSIKAEAPVPMPKGKRHIMINPE